MTSYREVLRLIAELEALRHQALVKSVNSGRARDLRDEAMRLQREAFATPDKDTFVGAFEKAISIDSKLNFLADAQLIGDECYEELKEKLIAASRRFVSRRR